MFCPSCKDEFRQGFTRCGNCDVDLVDDLRGVDVPPGPLAVPPPLPAKLIEYCGYLSLDEAREARARLRERHIRSEILLREPPDASWDEPASEEYWLRVDAARAKEVTAILGDVPEEADCAEDSGAERRFSCGECKELVAADEVVCPRCGARFDE